jgi:hypothetical protein
VTALAPGELIAGPSSSGLVLTFLMRQHPALGAAGLEPNAGRASTCAKTAKVSCPAPRFSVQRFAECSRSLPARAVTPRSHGCPDGVVPTHGVRDVLARQTVFHQLPTPARYSGLNTANAVWVYRPSGVQIPEPPPCPAVRGHVAAWLDCSADEGPSTAMVRSGGFSV